MELEIKRLAAFDFRLDDWAPSDAAEAWLGVTLGVGVSGEEGLNWFNVTVASPAAAATRNESGSRKGLVVSELAQSGSGIRQVLVELVGRCTAHDWDSSVALLRQHLEWEYENYVADTDK